MSRGWLRGASCGIMVTGLLGSHFEILRLKEPYFGHSLVFFPESGINRGKGRKRKRILAGLKAQQFSGT